VNDATVGAFDAIDARLPVCAARRRRVERGGSANDVGRRSAAGQIEGMSAAVKEVQEAALKLHPEEREEPIEELSASLDAADLGVYWEAEIKRRIDDVESGRVKTVPAEEVFSRLEQRFRGK
jgi:putative addiction module component (TIGR02574 family)